MADSEWRSLFQTGSKPVLTHTYLLCRIEEAYELFENKREGVIKVAVEC